MMSSHSNTPVADDEPLLSDHRATIQSADSVDDPFIDQIWPQSQQSHGEYKAYKRRWYMLLVVIVLNISNGMMWISFSPIADLTGHYYNISSSQVNWLSLVYPVATVPFGVVATWLLDTMGLRTGIVLAAWINCVGGGLRVISTIESVRSEKFTVLMLGQALCAVAQPFALFTPTKVAALWFPERQRAKANMMGSMANPVGIMIANLLSPVIMRNSSANIPFLLEMYLIPAGLGAVLASVGVWHSVPPTPPSPSAAEDSQPFLEGIKQLLRNKSYWVLAFSEGCGVALFTAITTLLQQILCTYGYSDSFAGLCGGLIIGVGFIGAAGAGAIVDKTKKFEEVAKISLSLGTVFMIVFAVLSCYSSIEIPIAASLCLFGLFGFALYPVAMELAVECTYPVAEATSSGILLIMGQILSILIILLMQLLARPLAGDTGQTCSPATPLDYLYSNILLCALGSFGSIIFVCGFKCSYKRLASEQNAEAERILNQRTAANDYSDHGYLF